MGKLNTANGTDSSKILIIKPVPDFLIYALSAIAIAYLIGIIVAVMTGKNSVETGKFTDAKINQGDQVYYLPTANILAKCTAKILISKDATGVKITDIQLVERSFEFVTQIVPDTDSPIALHYQPSIIANDELTLRVNAIGLLEGINVMTEDRISDIVTQISAAPRLIMSNSAPAPAAPAATPEVIETKEFSQTFLIFAAEISGETKIAKRTWQIPVDGTYDIGAPKNIVDASFSLQFQGMATATPVEANYEGVVTRPLTTIGITVDPDQTTPQSPQYYVQTPDISKLVCIPITRSSGVKKTYGFTFSNGNLTETIIKKPSEFESLIAIPIKIAKALISIPAELISFKIDTIKRQTNLETEKQKLDSALLTSRKNEIGLEAELLKAKLESQKTMLTHEIELAKIKIDADKSLLDSQKNVTVANKELSIAKKDWENAKKELEDLLKKIEAAKKTN